MDKRRTGTSGLALAFLKLWQQNRRLLAEILVGLALLFIGVILGGGSREHIVPVGTLVALIIGGGIGLGQLQIARMRHEEQTKADLQRRITESFTKAVEQLGSQHLQVRIGGIYVLERISRESDEDYWTVMETLTAFVRERARWKKFVPSDLADTLLKEDRHEVPTDVAAVISVIRRRRQQNRQQEQLEDLRFDLRLTDLRGTNLTEAHLEGAELRRVRLEEAFLGGAHLERAFLLEAHLEGAVLTGAHLERAVLTGAHLERADLEGADLTGAYLEGADLGEARLKGAFLLGAHLERAFLRGAHLEGAFLGAAHLEGADLTGAHLEGADLREAYLKGANLTGAYLEGADLTGAHLEGANLEKPTKARLSAVQQTGKHATPS